MNLNRITALLPFFLFSMIAMAQPNYPAPRGVYCSCGPSTGQGNGSVDPKVAEKDFVEGILVRTGWEYLEPLEGQYDWSIIHDQIARAKQYGKKISLGIGNGGMIPQWVFEEGAAFMEVLVPKTNDTIAVPWDSIHLHHWIKFIQAFGQEFNQDTTIRLVYITNASSNGFEMQLPFSTFPTLADLNYSDSKMIASWKQVVDAFDAAFPNHYLTNDFHPVNGSDVVADSVYAYASTKIGSRYGANAWWWTQKNTTLYPAQYALLKQSTTEHAFNGVQFAKSGTKDSAAFGSGGMPGAMQLAQQDGIYYWEIWNDDILNPAFEDLLSSASSLATRLETPVKERLLLFPNPCRSVLHIGGDFDLDEKVSLVFYSINGQKIWESEQRPGESISIQQTPLIPGLYFLQAKISSREVYSQKLLILE